MKRYALLFILLLLPETSVFAGSCPDLVDTMVEEEPGMDGENGAAPEEQFEHYINTISLFGIGFGFVDYPGFEVISYDLYLSHFWEVWRYGSVRAGAELITDFEEAFIADLTLGFDVYPFAYGITPFMGAELGVGYLQAGGQSGLGVYAAVEGGIFAIKIAYLTVATTVRLFMLSNTADNPAGALLRIGFFF